MNLDIKCNCDLVVEEGEFIEGYYTVYALQHKKNLNSVVKTTQDLEVKFFDIDDGSYTLYELLIKTTSGERYYIQNGKYYNSDNEEVSLSTIILDSAFSKQNVQFFSSMKLLKSYIEECLNVLNLSNRCETKVDTYRRDLLRSVVDVIGMLSDCGDFEKAQEILDRISGCNGLYSITKCGCKL